MMVGVGMTMNDHLYSRKRYIEIKICIFTFNYMQLRLNIEGKHHVKKECQFIQ